MSSFADIFQKTLETRKRIYAAMDCMMPDVEIKTLLEWYDTLKDTEKFFVKEYLKARGIDYIVKR